LPVQPRPARPGPATANCTPTTRAMPPLPRATRKPPALGFFPASTGTTPPIGTFGRANDDLLQPARAAPGRQSFRLGGALRMIFTTTSQHLQKCGYYAAGKSPAPLLRVRSNSSNLATR